MAETDAHAETGLPIAEAGPSCKLRTRSCVFLAVLVGACLALCWGLEGWHGQGLPALLGAAGAPGLILGITLGLLAGVGAGICCSSWARKSKTGALLGYLFGGLMWAYLIWAVGWASLLRGMLVFSIGGACYLLIDRNVQAFLRRVMGRNQGRLDDEWAWASELENRQGRSMDAVLIRITGVPPGEAPEEIRQRWVGMVLPLAAGETGARTVRTKGVLTGPRGFWLSLLHLLLGWGRPETGYLVDGRTAIELLAETAPEAAAWWLEHASHVLKPGYRLVFHAEICQEEF